MMTQVESDTPHQEEPHRSLSRHTELERRLARCLAEGARGRSAALIHLEVAGAWDLKDAAGRKAVTALRKAVTSTLSEHLADDVPLSSNGLCEFTLILEGKDPEQAVVEVRELKEAVGAMHFSWHGHPFSLSVHAGVLELGPDRMPAERWLGRALEACTAAGELAGDGIQLVAFNDHAWKDVAQSREWRRHVSEIIS